MATALRERVGVPWLLGGVVLMLLAVLLVVLLVDVEDANCTYMYMYDRV